MRWSCSCCCGLPRARRRARRSAAVAESFLLKLLSLSGFHPALTACAVCGARDVQLWSAGLGGAVCAGCAEPGAGPVLARGARFLAHAGAHRPRRRSGATLEPDARVRKEARALLVRVHRVPPGAAHEVGPDAREDGADEQLPPRHRPRPACPRTSRSSWTATAGGRSSAGCRAPRATAPARRRCGTRSRAPYEVGVRWLTVYAFSHRELVAPARRGALPHELQPRICSAAAATSSTTMNVRIRFIGRRDWRVPASRPEGDRASPRSSRATTPA